MATKVKTDKTQKESSVSIKTFSKGMQKDLDKSLMSNNTYLHAENFRLVADEEGTTGALENILGNKGFVTSYSVANQYICGYCMVRDTLILFMTINTASNPETGDANNRSTIYRVDFVVEDEKTTTSPVKIYDDNGLTPKLNFSLANPIKAVGRYETGNIQKIYWVDGYNKIRYANIAIDFSGYTVDQFEFLPNVYLEKPTLQYMVTGDILNGTIQYAYQLYYLNGAETAFSPVGNMIHLTPDSDAMGRSTTYEGGLPVESSGKGCRIQIDNTANTEFTRCRIVAIHHSYLNDTPSIRIAGEIEIDTAGTTFVFTDTGQSLGTYTLEEFVIIGTSLFSAGDLEVKDNILFAADIEEDYFDVGDWDARAYRFLDVAHGVDPRISRIYTSAGVLEHTIDGTGVPPDWPTMDGGTEEHYDAVNNYNDLDWDSHANYLDHQYMYQADGATLGAEGLNILVAFDVDLFTIDADDGVREIGASTESVPDVNESYKNYASPFNTGRMRSWHRSEIYRIGIVFFDEKGRRSHVLWICDLRIPKIFDYGGGENYQLNVYVVAHVARALYPKVQIKAASSLPTGAESYQIVRVERGSSDRTVIASGLLGAVDPAPAPPHEPEDMVHTSANADLLIRFASPEVSFNTNLTLSSTDTMEYIGTFSSAEASFGALGADNFDNKLRAQLGIAAAPANQTVIDDMDILSPSTTSHTINATPYANYSTVENAYGGTICVLDPQDAAWKGWGDVAPNGNYKGAYYRRNLFGSQYGGNSYESRSINTYIAASDIAIGKGAYKDAQMGDTFICYFNYLNLIWDLTQVIGGPGNSLQETISFIVETSINCDLRHDNCHNRVYNVTNHELLQEIAGTHTDGVVDYEQEIDLYQYNTVYSQDNTVIPYLAKPLDWDATLHVDTKVMASNTKVNGEESDSWTAFLFNNFIEVDSEYGSIISLLNWKNRLLYWQPRAYGVLSVNDRALITENNVAELALGTGDVLARYDYLSVEAGCSNKFGVIGTEDGIYWLDSKQRKVYNFAGLDVWDRRRKSVPLSAIKGMLSYFNSLKYISDVRLTNDRKFKEILFTVSPGRKGTITVRATPGGLYGFTYKIFMEDASDYPWGVIAGDYILVDGLPYEVTTLNPPDSLTIESKNDIYIGGSDERVTVVFDSDKITLAYNELVGAFISFYSFTPKWYIDLNSKYFLTTKTVIDARNLYIHNIDVIGTTFVAKRCHFAGKYYDSKIQVVFNDNYPSTKVFDNLMWLSDSTYPWTAGINYYADTFETVQCWNDYQHIGLPSTLVVSTGIGRPVDAFISEDNAVFTSETGEANNATVDDMTLCPIPAAANDRAYWGSTRKFDVIVLTVSTAGAGTYTLSWEYWDGTAWSALVVTDATGNFKVAGTEQLITFQAPNDWATTTVNTQGPFYYVRSETDAGTQTTQPFGTQTWLRPFSTVERRDRTWTMVIPRNVMDKNADANADIFDGETNWDSTQLYKERMRDKYLITEFVYDNSKGGYGYKFSVPLVACKYRGSAR